MWMGARSLRLPYDLYKQQKPQPQERNTKYKNKHDNVNHHTGATRHCPRSEGSSLNIFSWKVIFTHQNGPKCPQVSPNM